MKSGSFTLAIDVDYTFTSCRHTSCLLPTAFCLPAQMFVLHPALLSLTSALPRLMSSLITFNLQFISLPSIYLITHPNHSYHPRLLLHCIHLNVNVPTIAVASSFKLVQNLLHTICYSSLASKTYGIVANKLPTCNSFRCYMFAC